MTMYDGKYDVMMSMSEDLKLRHDDKQSDQSIKKMYDKKI
jgi:hypothetical protein